MRHHNFKHIWSILAPECFQDTMYKGNTASLKALLRWVLEGPSMYLRDNNHDGKKTLHVTIMVAFQQIQEGSLTYSILPTVTNVSSRSLKGYMVIKLHDSGTRGTPKPTQSKVSRLYNRVRYDRFWLLVRSVKRAMTDHTNTAPVQTNEWVTLTISQL